MNILEQLDRLSSQVPPLVQQLSLAESLTSGSQVEEGVLVALRVEPIQRALASGLVATSPDGCCRGFAFCSDEAHRRCETMGDACRQIQGDGRSNPRNRK